MAVKPPETRCAVADCKGPVTVGQLICEGHRPKPLTLKERIAKRPHWYLRKAKDAAPCAACGDPADGMTDGDTGLCRPCWRAWRWSPIGEYESQ